MRRVVLGWIVLPLALLAGFARGSDAPEEGKTRPNCCLETPPVPTYREFHRHVEVVAGRVVDWELSPKKPSADWNPLLLVSAEYDFTGNRSGSLLFDVTLRSGPVAREEVKKGQFVVVTFYVEDSPETWSCGRLRACDERPAQRLVAIEMYRQHGW